VRVVLQRGEPGLNPKVNQLVTLARAARHAVLVVSDSNVRVGAGYLDEIAAALDDPSVGLVTHPVVGVGETRLGSLCDNLHLAGGVGAGMIGLKRVVRKDVVVGKSMALRRDDLRALGGFEAVGDVLAEDYVLGQMVPRRLHKRVALARGPVENVSQRRSLREFLKRYQRWSVMHRRAVGPGLYACGLLVLNPTMVACAGALAAPSRMAWAAVAACGALKVIYDVEALRLLRGGRWSLAAFAASPIKDALLAAAWVRGWLWGEVVWRETRLRVRPGTRLERRPPREPRMLRRALRRALRPVMKAG
jgi:ceramide glucosyltransferase